MVLTLVALRAANTRSLTNKLGDDSLSASGLTLDSIQPDTIDALEAFLRSIGLNDKKIDCFWDRLEGMTFVQMAEQDPAPSATPDKYRKRFRRLIERLELFSDKFREILLNELD